MTAYLGKMPVAFTLSGKGGSGDVVLVKNNTNASINKWDKVWLNKDISEGFIATSEYNNDSITGFAQTGAEVGEYFTVMTILPKLINVYVSVDADNAYIGVE